MRKLLSPILHRRFGLAETTPWAIALSDFPDTLIFFRNHNLLRSDNPVGQLSSDDIITVRVRREWAQFLQLNVAMMVERTHDAIRTRVLPQQRHEALAKRAMLLGRIDDVLRDALIGEMLDKPAAAHDPLLRSRERVRTGGWTS